MKKAYVVELPEDLTVDLPTFRKLYDHALKSTIWYVTNYSRNSQQLREKLLCKGYSEEQLTVIRKDGSKVSFDLIEKVLEEVAEMELLDDNHYAESYARNRLAQGYGLSRIRTELLRKKVDAETAATVIATLQAEQEERGDEVDETLLRQVETYRRSSTYQREGDAFKRNSKLKARFVQRGYSFEQVQRVLDALDIEEEETWD